MLAANPRKNLRSRWRASVLVGVLWCVALLAVMVVGLLHTTRLDLRIARQQADKIQAHYLAIAGIEKAKALLLNDALTRSRSGVHHAAGLYDAPAHFRDVPLGRGQFRIIRPPSSDEAQAMMYGVLDEGSRLNINTVEAAELGKIVGLTPDVAAAIVDWRDGDNAVSPGGAEAPYYTSLQPPYLPRNASFQTLRELLMVRGITSDLLLGDPKPVTDGAPVGRTSAGSSSVGSELSSEEGWARWLTAHSKVENVDASGVARIPIQTADVGQLTGIQGITTDIARAIVAHRERNRFQTVIDLLDVRKGQQGRNVPGVGQASGPTLINETLLKDIADRLTIEEGTELTGLVNANTASVEVLQCLPGMDRTLAEAVISHRRANGYFQSVADLLGVAGFNRELVKQLAPRFTTRAETFRILSEGRVGIDGVTQRIQAVVHVALQRVTTLAYREDDL